MKKILLTVLAMLTVFSMRAQELNNRSILEMIELGFTDEVIIAKIKSSSCNFDTDINSLKSLKESGVSSDVIVAMLEKQSPQTKENRNGIYAEYNDSVVKIFPSSFSATRTRAFGLTSSMRSVMSGESSKNILSSDFPVFYFYFSNSDKSLLGSSPNEYALVRLTSEKGKRSVKTGDFNAFFHSLELVIKSRDSISGFCTKAGIDRAMLYQIFHGERIPRVDTLAKILKTLGYTLQIA